MWDYTETAVNGALLAFMTLYQLAFVIGAVASVLGAIVYFLHCCISFVGLDGVVTLG